MWARYNYILAAAFDMGYNLCVVILFFAVGLSGVRMANWWGNDVDGGSVERCFALEGG